MLFAVTARVVAFKVICHPAHGRSGGNASLRVHDEVLGPFRHNRGRTAVVLVEAVEHVGLVVVAPLVIADLDDAAVGVQDAAGLTVKS